MKTVELKDEREAEILKMDDTVYIITAKHLLEQYSHMKKIIINLSFRDKQRLILSSDIVFNVIDELRHERKIQMVIQDKDIDEYINHDIS
jgi:hypothetical protein